MTVSSAADTLLMNKLNKVRRARPTTTTQPVIHDLCFLVLTVKLFQWTIVLNDRVSVLTCQLNFEKQRVDEMANSLADLQMLHEASDYGDAAELTSENGDLKKNDVKLHCTGSHGRLSHRLLSCRTW